MIQRNDRRHRAGRALGAVLLGLLLCLAVVPGTRAHAVLVRADPAPGSVVGSAPGMVRIWLSEPVQAPPDAVVVTGPDGSRVDGGDARVAPDDATQLQVTVRATASGTYEVRWRAISADTHPVGGSFQFSVGAPSGGVAPAGATTTADSSGRAWAAVARWLHLLGVVLALGPLVFGIVVLGRLRDSDIDVRLWRLSRIGAGVVIVAAPLLLLAQAVGVGGSLSAGLSDGVLRSLVLSGYGARWAGRLALAALLLALSWSAVRRGRSKRLGRSWAITALVLGAVLLLLTSLNGHAAATAPVWLSVLADWIHLGATVAWFGGLAALVAAVRPALAARPDTQRLAVLAWAMPRFSTVALVSVELLILTGLYATWAHVPDPAALVDTGYGVALLVKLGLIAVTLGFAAVNRLVLRPRLRAAAASNPHPPKEADAVMRDLTRTIGAEALLGVAILAVVGVLTVLPPSQQAIASSPAGTTPGVAAPAASTQPAVTLAQNAGSTLVTLSLDPAMPGANQAVVSLLDSTGNPVTDARVRVRARPSDGGGASAVTQMEAENGRFRGTVILAPAGAWHLEVLVTLPGQPEVAAPFDLTLPLPDAGALLSLADQAMNGLHSLREHNELGNGGATVVTEFRYAAPDRMHSIVQTPTVRRETIAIGDRRFDREGNGPWQESPWPEPGGYRWPAYNFAGSATEVSVLGREELDGVDCFVVAFLDPASGARFRLWIGTTDYLIRQQVMMAPGHYMTSVFSDFNAPVTIEEP
ncbi:CopD family protein [Sphaerobacter sp.]|uniref:copper resistance CopC/CopD family protein n=1 Tax=Sphaerobacter sp. TaxID=2099654 RepID=UPI001E0C7525|nr:CopD family protein [Sphaerobacter sp.]MBX5445261.1 CopD family protein [Sphaerobacter sp.]